MSKIKLFGKFSFSAHGTKDIFFSFNAVKEILFFSSRKSSTRVDNKDTFVSDGRGQLKEDF